MSGKKSSSARQFFCIEKCDRLDKLTKVMVATACDRCTITDENGKVCGATFKRCVRNGTSALIKHLKTVQSEKKKSVVQIDIFFEKNVVICCISCDFDANLPTSSERSNDAFYMCIT